MSASAWLYKPMDNMATDKPGTSMTNAALELELYSVVRSSMYPCPGNWVAMGLATVY